MAQQIVQLSTEDKLEYQWVPLNPDWNELTFKVRAPHDAHLCLTSTAAESTPMLEIFIGGWKNTLSIIRRNRTKTQPEVCEANTPQFLDAGEYRGFWIRYRDNVLTVGREGEVASFLDCVQEQPFPMLYLGVCTGWGASGDWIIEPSFSRSANLTAGGAWNAPPASSGACWVDSQSGQVPPNAVSGGTDGEQLYIGRAVHEGCLIPGKVVPSHGVCYVAWGGGEHGHEQYQVLCGCNPQWVPTSGAAIPNGALPAGETEEGEPLFVGRASHEGTVTVGKVQASHGVCYIPYAGQELGFDQYEVLVSE